LRRTDSFQNLTASCQGNWSSTVKTVVPSYSTAHLQFVRDEQGKATGILAEGKNITDRKRTEEALRQSESKFRNLYESANDAIFLMDKNIFVDCNLKTLEMFGCTREQIIGQPLTGSLRKFNLMEGTSMEKALEKINAALKGQKQFFEWTHSRYDGTPFDARVSLNTFSTEDKYSFRLLFAISPNASGRGRRYGRARRKYRTILKDMDDVTLK